MNRLRAFWNGDAVTIAVLVGLTFATYVKFIPLIEPLVIPGFAGFLCGFAFWHPFRGLGFVPICYTVAAVAALLAPWIGHSVTLAGIASVALGFAYQRLASHLSFDPRTRTIGRLLIGMAVFALGFMMLATIVPMANDIPDQNMFAFGGILALLAVFSWVRLFRPVFELGCEPILWVMYRIRAAGPGIVAVPPRGGCIVVANHACWLDPLFLAKVLPRPITPMMTSKFYDKPALRWLAKQIFHVIRVPEGRFRKMEMPDEIREAIAALDRGECLVIFPEGLLRRSEDKPLKRFGRGVWQILEARPETPVFACWIEGGWGGYFSYFKGNPTKNKRPDLRRKIDVAIPEPIRLDSETLADHLTTRIFLMNRVIESRKLLGLPDLPPFELPKHEGAAPIREYDRREDE